ncbi:hypothetical protein MP228_003726 [Amoeboaphelidium protococcarum]|nr:hypothetical protein MP228_003726 [Amoeboaphelidium protococcarum]
MSFECLEERLESFNKWKLKYPSADELAHHGFYHAPSEKNPDRVACYVCSVTVMNWQQNDTPLDRHRQAYCDCPLVKIYSMQSFPLSNEVKKARRQTFGKWWPHIKPFRAMPSKLAECGFVYAPTMECHDLCECLYCHIKIGNWKEGDDPLVLHKQKNPQCPFLLEMDGQSVMHDQYDSEIIKSPRLRPNRSTESVFTNNNNNTNNNNHSNSNNSLDDLDFGDDNNDDDDNYKGNSKSNNRILLDKKPSNSSSDTKIRGKYKRKQDSVEPQQKQQQQSNDEPPKRKRGRPKKNPEQEVVVIAAQSKEVVKVKESVMEVKDKVKDKKRKSPEVSLQNEASSSASSSAAAAAQGMMPPKKRRYGADNQPSLPVEVQNLNAIWDKWKQLSHEMEDGIKALSNQSLSANSDNSLPTPTLSERPLFNNSYPDIKSDTMVANGVQSSQSSSKRLNMTNDGVQSLAVEMNLQLQKQLADKEFELKITKDEVSYLKKELQSALNQQFTQNMKYIGVQYLNVEQRRSWYQGIVRLFEAQTGLGDDHGIPSLRSVGNQKFLGFADIPWPVSPSLLATNGRISASAVRDFILSDLTRSEFSSFVAWLRTKFEASTTLRWLPLVLDKDYNVVLQELDHMRKVLKDLAIS